MLLYIPMVSVTMWSVICLLSKIEPPQKWEHYDIRWWGHTIRWWGHYDPSQWERYDTYSPATQWAAVMMCLLSAIEPPQKWEPPKSRETIQGRELGSACQPPTILSFLSGNPPSGQASAPRWLTPQESSDWGTLWLYIAIDEYIMALGRCHRDIIKWAMSY